MEVGGRQDPGVVPVTTTQSKDLCTAPPERRVPSAAGELASPPECTRVYFEGTLAGVQNRMPLTSSAPLPS